jgi:AraC-like DNA-binding protein
MMRKLDQSNADEVRPAPFLVRWADSTIAAKSRRVHFGRPLREVLPGLLTGEYEGTYIPPHTHEALLVVLPVARFVVLGGGAAAQTEPGDIWVRPKLELHGAMAGMMHCSARLFLVSPDLLGEVAGTVGGQGGSAPRFGNRPLTDPVLAQALSVLWQELERPVKSADLADHCRSLLRELARRHADSDRAPGEGRRTDLVIRRVQEHLQHHVSEPVALEELASAARLSKSYLVREFHRVVGLPPHAYHVQLRVARAASLIATGMPLGRVAFAAGFADQSHLSRTFKVAYGLTPLGFARAVGTANGSARALVTPRRRTPAIPFNKGDQDAVRRAV